MNLENNYTMGKKPIIKIPLYDSVYVKYQQVLEIENELVAAKGWRGDNGECLLIGTEFIF